MPDPHFPSDSDGKCATCGGTNKVTVEPGPHGRAHPQGFLCPDCKTMPEASQIGGARLVSQFKPQDSY